MAVTNVRMQIDQLSQDKTNNFSTVRVRGFATMTGQSYNDYTKTGTYNLDGQAYTFQTTLPKGTTKTLFDVQHPVYHNPDGTKTVTGSFSLATGISAGTISASTELTLTTIPRATYCPALSGNINSQIIENINPASTDFTHKLCFVANGTEIVLQDGFYDQINFTVPTVLYDYIPNADQISGELRLYTYNNGVQIGVYYNSATFYVTVDETTLPVITELQIEDINEETLALTGNANKIINHKSTVQATISAYAQASSPITEYGLG